jgi:L-fuconolactonase
MKSRRPIYKTSVTRREFLRASAMAGSAAAVFGPNLSGQAADSKPIHIIDTHVHFYDPSKPGGVPWPPPSDRVLYSPHLPQTFQPLTEKLGVAGVVVIEAEALPADNQWVLDLAKDNPLIVGYIGRLLPGQPDFAEHFDRYAADPIFRGLRLRHQMMGLSGDRAFEQDILRIAEKKLTVDLAGDATIIEDAVRLTQIAPPLRLVIDHLPFREWGQNVSIMRKVLGPIAKLPNVFGKISDVPRRVNDQLVTDPEFYRPMLDAIRELFGDGRIIYGSNWPVSDLVAPYSAMHRIVTDYFGKLDPSVAEKFFWRNSAKAYQWIPRGAAKSLAAK